MRKIETFDRTIFFITLFLIVLGIVMTYSSTTIIADERYKDSLYFFKKQLVWGMLGIGMMIGCSNLNYKLLQKRVLFLPLFVITLSLLIIILPPFCSEPFCKRINGSYRWLKIGGLSIQSSEFAKLMVIIFLSRYAIKNGEKIENFKSGLIFPLSVIGVIMFLIIVEPDAGTAIFIGTISMLLLFIAGTKKTHVLLLSLSGISSLSLFIMANRSNYNHITDRLGCFIDPWSCYKGAGFQIVQSLLAFGRGGLLGVGIAEGRQKLFFLPEVHTDFIFALIGEELGLFVTVTIISLYIILFWKGFRIAMHTSDRFGRYLAYGIVLMINLHVMINVSVVTGLLPTTGLSLPFLSYGGSSLIVNSIGVGILLNISKEMQTGVRR
ncbi:MAG: putative lipid II flippase FtsW [Nitrospirota bacterium]